MTNKISILDVLDNTIHQAHIRGQMFELYGKLAEWEVKLGVNELTELGELPAESREPIRELLLELDRLKATQSTWQKQYKDSIKKLIEINKGLPVHINAEDIHEHNLNIDEVKAQAEDEEDEVMDILKCFTDGSIGLWAVAPYNVSFIQLENQETFENALGRFYDRAQKKENRRAQLKEIFSSDEEVLDRIDRDMTGGDSPEEQRAKDIDRQTVILCQSYKIDDFVDYMHLQHVDDAKVGYEVKDTLQNFWSIDELFEEGREEEKELLNKKFGGEVNMTDFSFVQVYDVISVTNGTWYLENQVLAWLDENGSPTMTRKIVYNDIRKKELDSQSAFYSHAVEKVFQWWNMDNDLLEVADLDVRPSWTKKLKKYNKKSNNKQKSIRYKTLVVRPTIKVIDSNGVERTPKMREIAQHTRRGHFAHYGINGKGKLFGKYTKTVYRKPKTVGKLSNGLILKDYTLETERGEEE